MNNQRIKTSWVKIQGKKGELIVTTGSAKYMTNNKLTKSH